MLFGFTLTPAYHPPHPCTYSTTGFAAMAERDGGWDASAARAAPADTALRFKAGKYLA